MEKYRTIISKLEDWAGQKVLSAKTKGGDDGISKVDLLTFEKGNTCFLKTGNCAVDVFEKEAKGLHELRKAKAIRVLFNIHP